MLTKVLKYDLKLTYKTLAGFYAVLMIFAYAAGDERFFNGSYFSRFIEELLKLSTAALITATVVMSLWIVFQRFAENLYGNESYFTHTLPVSRTTVYVSKFLSLLTVLLTSAAVCMAAYFLAFYSGGRFSEWQRVLRNYSNIYGISIAIVYLLIFAVCMLQMICLVQCGHFGIITGHRANDGKNVKSVVLGFCMYLIINAAGSIGFFAAGSFSPKVRDLFYNGTADIKTLCGLLSAAGIYYAASAALLFVICLKIFKKGVNVE